MNTTTPSRSPWIRRFALTSACILLAVSAIWILNRTVEKGPPPKRGFYFWKTQWSASAEMLDALNKNGADRLYMRFFDVEWDAESRAPYPVSPIQLQSPMPSGIEIVPVVFLTNAVFLNLPAADIDALADRVWHRVDAMTRQEKFPFHELQIDCDWSDRSRQNYFRFAEQLERKAKADGKMLSATLRLHQIKYKARTGIPPVDRGMLMFYNFGKIEADSPRNSIFNVEDAERYVSYIAAYPLSLDVALPLFSWSVHSRDGAVLGLMEKLGNDEIAAFDGFRGLSPNRFTASRSFFFRGRYFMEGDRVLVEETTPETAGQAAALASRGAGSKRFGTVALFDLDGRHPENYGKDRIQPVWNALR